MSSLPVISLLLIFFSVLPSDVSGFACYESEFSCRVNFISCTLTTSNQTRANYLLAQCTLDYGSYYNAYIVYGLDNATLVLNIPSFISHYYLTIQGTNTLIISNVEILLKEFTLSSNGLLTIPHFPSLPIVEFLNLESLELETVPTIDSPNLSILGMNYFKLPNVTVILPSMLVIPSLRYLTLAQDPDSPWFLLSPNTFDNIVSISGNPTYITLKGVLHLNSYQFANIVKLRCLSLFSMSSNVTYKDDSLAGLPTLVFLSIERSEINAIDLMLQVTFPNVVAFYLKFNLITSLPQEFFERQKSLLHLDVYGNPLNCTCEMSWVSYVYHTLERTIIGTCINGNNIFDNSNYVNCPIQSYHCFNDTLLCPTDRSRCVNTQDSAYCECFQGYTLNASTCIDIDECSLETDNCSQNCVNTEGEYNCTCLLGYSLDSDLTSCIDIDECSLETDNCSQNCVNTEGEYNCTCLLGYSLDSDLTSCLDINECSLETDNCSQNCVNTEGEYNCTCLLGYSLDSDLTSCLDTDECSLETDNCSQNCVNTEGEYNCTCLLGYSLDSDLTSCLDINECSLETDNCSQNCTNTEGSYECICEDGYILQSDFFSCNKSGGSRLTIGLAHILLLLALLLGTTTL